MREEETKMHNASNTSNATRPDYIVCVCIRVCVCACVCVRVRLLL